MIIARTEALIRGYGIKEAVKSIANIIGVTPLPLTLIENEG